jgi:hypothetical protein
VKLKPANVLLWIVAALAIAFVTVNWGMLSAPIQTSFGFTRVSMPLGLILLALALVLMAVFFGLLLRVQIKLVAIHRRHAAELRAHRELAETAEGSRFTELRQYLQQELASLGQAQRASEQRMQQEILAMTNTVAACIGEIDERLERQWPSSAAQQP